MSGGGINDYDLGIFLLHVDGRDLGRKSTSSLTELKERLPTADARAQATYPSDGLACLGVAAVNPTACSLVLSSCKKLFTSGACFRRLLVACRIARNCVLACFGGGGRASLSSESDAAAGKMDTRWRRMWRWTRSGSGAHKQQRGGQVRRHEQQRGEEPGGRRASHSS